MTDETKEIAVLVCADARRDDPPFADNCYGKCEGCQQEIMWRPYNNGDYKRLCFDCALKLAEEAKANGEPVEVKGPTPETKRELGERYSQQKMEDAVAMAKRIFEGG